MKKIGLQLLAVLLLATACKRTGEDDPFVGPADTTTPENFSVAGDTLTPGYDLINFQNYSQYFLASFSHKVAWRLEVTGTESGATKHFSGVADRLDATTLDFDGDADNMAFFRRGETCRALLSIEGWETTYRTHFQINQTKVFDCVVVDDFESAAGSQGFEDYFEDSGDSQIEYRNSGNTSVLQGFFSMDLSGFDSDENYWISAVTTVHPNLAYILPTVDANELYINLFAKGKADESTSIEVQLLEDENDDNVFTPGVDALWKKQFSLDENWQQYSAAYSGFQKNSAVDSGNMPQPSKLLKMRIVLLSVPAGNAAHAQVDFVNFTSGKPFAQQ